MRPADLPAVFIVQCAAHPADYHEPLEALASRLVAGAEHCFVAECSAGEVAAYVFAHPWSGPPPALHQPLPSMPATDHLFLHDLAVMPAWRGVALGGRLHAAVLESARACGFIHLRLVAVGAAVHFWRGLGYQTLVENELPPGYGAASVMACRVLPGYGGSSS